MNKTLLRETLEVTTVSGMEDNMIDYITSFGIKHDIPVIQDAYGNIYLKKGTLADGEAYPLVIAHMDTVHWGQKDLVLEKKKINVIESESNGKEIFYGTHPNIVDDAYSTNVTGVGGDDKAGVAICLDLMLKNDKIIGAFFKEEEIGCRGSLNLDTEVLKGIGYAIQFDAPSGDWVSYICNGVQLFNRDFYKKLEPIFKKYKITNFMDSDPFTDIHLIKKIFDVNTINLFSGYINAHTKYEHVVIDDVNKAASMGNEIIKKVGPTKQEFIHTGFREPLELILKND